MRKSISFVRCRVLGFVVMLKAKRQFTIYELRCLYGTLRIKMNGYGVMRTENVNIKGFFLWIYKMSVEPWIHRC